MKILLAGMLAVGGFAAAGCEHHNEGIEARQKAQAMSKGADMIQQGEAEQREGERMIAEGKAAKDQHNDAQGDSLIAAGNAKVKSGKAMIAEGKKLQEKED
jgi:hypothetical protein